LFPLLLTESAVVFDESGQRKPSQPPPKALGAVVGMAAVRAKDLRAALQAGWLSCGLQQGFC